MSNRVNPPKQLVLPPEVAQNKQLKKAFDDRDFILFQIWKRIGAGTDLIDLAINSFTSNYVSQILDIRLNTQITPVTIDTTGFTVDTTQQTTDKTKV